MKRSTLCASSQAAYESRIRRFEADMGKPAAGATEADALAWINRLGDQGVSPSTRRSCLSSLNRVAGLNVHPCGLPPQKRGKPTLLTDEQEGRILDAMSSDDRMIYLRILMSGTASGQPYTPRELNRRLHRYARKAQVDAPKVSLRVWIGIGQVGNAAERVGAVRDRRLHGIGRRSARVPAGD